MSEEIDEKHPPQQRQTNPLTSQAKRYKSFSSILWIIINISLSSFYFGYTIIYMSVVDFSTIIQIFGISMSRSKAEGLLTFCVPLGGFFGSLISSYFINYVSRRKSILIINCVAMVVGVLIFTANLQMYMLLRVFQGMCAGIYSALVPLLIKELAPIELSGVFGVFPQLFITVGIFVSCFLSFILSQIYSDPTGSSYWRFIFAFSLIVLVVQTFVLFFIFPFETPKYLIDNNDESKAKELISYIYRSQFTDEVFRQLKGEPLSQKDINMKDTTSQDDAKVQEPEGELKITKIIALHLALLQQFVGISAVATYASEIAEGNLSSFKSVLPSIINFQQVVTALISSALLSKYGRKTILQAGTAGAVVTNLIIAIGFFLIESSPKISVFLVLLGLFCFMANFGLSLGPIVWMYIPEIVAPSFLPYSTMMNWGGSALSILLFPIIKSKLPNQNPALMFLFFALWSFISYIINKKYIIETKGKTNAQIQQEYQRLQIKSS